MNTLLGPVLALSKSYGSIGLRKRFDASLTDSGAEAATTPVLVPYQNSAQHAFQSGGQRRGSVPVLPMGHRDIPTEERDSLDSVSTLEGIGRSSGFQ